MTYKYLTMLSQRQKVWFVISVSTVLLISILGILYETDRPSQSDEQFSVTMGIWQIAPELGVTGKGLARELGLPLNVPKKKPLDTFEISQEQLGRATSHILSHRSTGLKYYLFAAIVLFGFVFSKSLQKKTPI